MATIPEVAGVTSLQQNSPNFSEKKSTFADVCDIGVGQ